MGKQSKRKGNKRKSGGHHRPSLATDPSLSISGAANTGNDGGANGAAATVVSKIRHGDARVRHAALVALSSTLYDANSLKGAAERAVSSTNNMTSSTTIGAANTNNAVTPSNPILLRALSERILDQDVPCATAACGCLSNYVLFYASSVGGDASSYTGTTNNNYCGATANSVGGGQKGDSEELEVASQVMVPILLQRVQLSLQTLEELMGQFISTAADPATAKNNKSVAASPNNSKNSTSSTSSNDKLLSTILSQWTLLSLSLQTLAGLIENCNLAVQRMSVGVAFAGILSVLRVAAAGLVGVGSTAGGDGASITKDTQPILDAATNAARALHSLLDDNVALISCIPTADNTTAVSSLASPTTALPNVISVVTVLTKTITNTHFSPMTRLHASGAVLSLRRILVVDSESDGQVCNSSSDEKIRFALQSCASNVILPMLCGLFELNMDPDQEDGSSSTNPSLILKKMMVLSNQLQTQKQDEDMESEIVNEINARKEPARLIARRQKEEKDRLKEQKQQLKTKDGDGVAIMEDGDNTKQIESAGTADAAMVEDDASGMEGAETADVDLKEELDNVIQSWRDLVGSHKLALELVANLCSGKEDEEDDDEGGMMYGDDENEHMWDSDDEAQLVASSEAAAANSNAQSNSTPSEKEMYTSMATHHLTEQILIFFRNWAMFLPSLNGEYPRLVLEDVEEVLATCTLCLGNMIACDIPTWASATARKEIVAVLCDGPSVENGTELYWWGLVSMLGSSAIMTENTHHEVKAHITSVILSLLRHQPHARTLVDSPRLDLMHALLSMTPDDKPESRDANDALVRTHCNVIAMLGVLCSEPHPATVNTRVCSALMVRLRSPLSNTNSDSSTYSRQSVIVVNEIYNVLMDMYGGDDCHDDVFEQQDVLGHLQRSLPGFKRSIKRVAPSERSREEVDIWSETALNASRFIKYKRIAMGC
ncbi:predicted protein [Thalassiosira pseudonana CCMP1335]|uniref:SYO1-like TPR repeats domain-containing protein n=1 Tax=Thalassiosira pseudonana TaxID=35128 RepID=B8C7G5_THAPS|nr:predicted protein [Thalassiosira pseudonana CCMP1335]EED90979.1 predicted protein [Thalassiosira pseudonana CCMP1335]|eukprot:scaffold14119_cov428-Alexandrium_tamarense.AAC.10